MMTEISMVIEMRVWDDASLLVTGGKPHFHVPAVTIKMPNLSTLVALEFAIMTTTGATSDKKLTSWRLSVFVMSPMAPFTDKDLH